MVLHLYGSYHMGGGLPFRSMKLFSVMAQLLAVAALSTAKPRTHSIDSHALQPTESSEEWPRWLHAFDEATDDADAFNHLMNDTYADVERVRHEDAPAGAAVPRGSEVRVGARRPG